MKSSASRVSLAAAAAGLAITSGAVAAEQTNEIIVEAPHIERTAERAPSTGSPIDIISVTHRVSYRDIDIGTSSGAKVLEQRIKDAAKAACKEIDTLYPLKKPLQGDLTCEKAATDKAMLQARAAIAAAEKAHN
jgi:UrcA family protein